MSDLLVHLRDLVLSPRLAHHPSAHAELPRGEAPVLPVGRVVDESVEQDGRLFPVAVEEVGVAELGLEGQDDLWLVLHSGDALQGENRKRFREREKRRE